MTEYLGSIEIPEIEISGTFPLVPDRGFGMSQAPEVVVHRFGSANAKIEQRYLLGNGVKRFLVRKQSMRESERIALRDFWEDSYGPYGAFTYNAPNNNGVGTTAYTVRFANEPLSWQFLSDSVSTTGVTLIEVPDPATAPTYTVNSTNTRFPSASLETALLSQVQEVIPLVKIQVRETGYAAIYLSDRRCTVGGQLYQPRLLRHGGISQSVNNESDSAQFVFGNADRVFRDLANSTDLTRASLEFSLFHVGTGIKLDLWKGEIVDWSLDSGPEFVITASDDIYELTLPYPTRRISRTCWKAYNDGVACPYAAQGSLDTTHFPSANASRCDKGYDTANGCLAHRMKRYFGGLLAEPQSVTNIVSTKQIASRWKAAFANLTAQSIVADSIYDQVLPEIYANNPSYKDEQNTTKYGMPVPCQLAMGRDEGDFYSALGVVGEGPVTFGTGHTLDGMYHHGHGTAQPTYGLRTVAGSDPAGSTDYFSLDSVGDSTGGDWRKVLVGNATYKDNFAAGTAFLTIRRNDDKGLQLSRPGDHQMEAVIRYGISGWVWTAAGVRSWQVLANPVWVAVNMLLKAKGLRNASAAVAEQYFDVTAAIAAAAICNLSVTKIVGTGSETQFTFQGIVQDEKPARDWITDVLMSCLGYYTRSFGKLKIGIRTNSSAVEAFTVGNILFGSLRLTPKRPSFNYLTGYFADQEFKFINNSVAAYDDDHAKLIGGSSTPQFLKAQINLSGVSTKSQAARVVTTRLREELGGISATQWKNARHLEFDTTILSLAVEPGMVCSMTHGDMPGGAGEFRVKGWRLNDDYSISIEGDTTVDEMYDLSIGPKPADVQADPVPVEAEYVEAPFTELYTAADVAYEAKETADSAASTASEAQAAASAAQAAADTAILQLATYDDQISDLTSALETKITIFYQTSQPTANTTGDIWYDTDASPVVIRRWNGSSWIDITTVALSAALSAASSAQSTADGKIVTFAQTSQPTATAIGDLWVDTDDNNRLRRWNGSTWASLQDTHNDATVASHTSQISSLTTAVNAKVTIFYQAAQPTANVAGDIWYETDVSPIVIRRWSGSAWVDITTNALSAALAAAGDAQATADGKVNTFAQAAQPTAESIGDLWVETDNNNKLYRWSGSAWVDVQDTHNDSTLSTHTSQISGLTTAVNSKVTIFYQTNQPTANVAGDIWYDTDANPVVIYRWNGSSWVDITTTALSAALDAAGDAQATADGKIITFAQAAQPTAVAVGDLWIDTDDNNRLRRWSGSAWADLRDGLVNTHSTQITNLTTAVNSKITIFYQTSQPTANVTGDIWYDTDASPVAIYRWSGSVWVNITTTALSAALSAAASAQATADGKIKTFAQTSAPTAGEVGDFWVDTDDSNRLYRWSGSAWVDVRDAGIALAQQIANAKSKVYYQTSQPGAASTGDLWFDTDDSYRAYAYNGSTWVLAHDWYRVLAGLNADGTVAADKVVAGSVVAGEITVNKLKVIPENLNPDPYFDDLSFWTLETGWYLDNGTGGSRRAAILGSGDGTRRQFYSDWIPFSGSGHIYELSIRGINLNSTADVYVFVFVKLNDDSVVYLGGSYITLPHGMAATKTFKLNAMAPDNAKEIQFVAFNQEGVARNSWCGIWDWKLQEAAGVLESSPDHPKFRADATGVYFTASNGNPLITMLRYNDYGIFEMPNAQFLIPKWESASALNGKMHPGSVAVAWQGTSPKLWYYDGTHYYIANMTEADALIPGGAGGYAGSPPPNGGHIYNTW
jgi:hypothetical protein